MVLNPTFNNSSVISWWSVLLVEEIRVPGENHKQTGIRLYYYFIKEERKYQNTILRIKS
jgi:hypothetical protein